MKIKMFMKKLYMDDLSDIPVEFKEEFQQELLRFNYKRIRILSFILIATIVMLFCLEAYVSGLWTKDIHFFGGISAFHGLLLAVSAIYLTLTCKRLPSDIKWLTNNKSWIINRTMHTLYLSFTMLFCSHISLRNIWVNKQPFTYIIVIFCIASTIMLTQNERYLIYSLSYLAYTLGIILHVSGFYLQIENIFFITLLVILAFFVSHFNYNSFSNNFIKGKIISEKNKELDSLNRVIEDALNKRTEELNKIVEYDNLRATFFANISHELKTPLTVIFSAHQMMNLLLEGLHINERKKDMDSYMRIIRQNCYRLIRIITNLIDITKIDSNFLQINLQNLNVVKIVEDITLSVAKFIQDKGIKVTFDTEIEEEIIAIDPDKIERVMLNLLSNAVKFTPKGGNIYINLYDTGDMIEIHVEDTGIGIPLKMKDLIFERFVQVDGTTSRTREGSGIGLSLVRSLIELHGGSIKLNCKSEGSEFIFSLPKRTVHCDRDDRSKHLTTEKHSIEMINIEFSDIYY